MRPSRIIVARSAPTSTCYSPSTLACRVAPSGVLDQGDRHGAWTSAVPSRTGPFIAIASARCRPVCWSLMTGLSPPRSRRRWRERVMSPRGSRRLTRRSSSLLIQSWTWWWWRGSCPTPRVSRPVGGCADRVSLVQSWWSPNAPKTSNRLAGLDAGADDFMGKPFGVAGRHARVRALLRRGMPLAPGVTQVRIDEEARRVFVGRAGCAVDPQGVRCPAGLGNSPRTSGQPPRAAARGVG